MTASASITRRPARGTPIVFVHEFAGDYRSYETQLRYFARRYRCIAYNARGYPPSDVPDDPARYSQDRARDDIRAVLDGLAIDEGAYRRHLDGRLCDAAFRLRLSRARAVAGRRRLRLWRRARQAPAIPRRDRAAPRRRSKAPAWPRSRKTYAPARPACSSRTRTRAAMPSSPLISPSIRPWARPTRCAACRRGGPRCGI